jgi:parvulin-like peptidyl-prolyl isomerase
VWVKHILIKAASTATQEEKDAAKKKAEDIIAQLKGGADFATLAKEKSEDGSSSWGGDYLFGKGQMYTEFETAAFALSPGQITETPVLTDAGYHIIKLEEKYAKDEPASLRCAKEYNEYGTTFIKYKLYTQKMDEWSKNAKVKKNDAVYNSLK